MKCISDKQENYNLVITKKKLKNYKDSTKFSGKSLFSQQIAFEKASNERIEKQFQLMKQLCAEEYENIATTINQLFEITNDSELPDCFNKMVIYALVDIVLIRVQHLDYTREDFNSKKIATLSEINKILSCPDMKKNKLWFLKIMKNLNIIEKDLSDKGKMKDIYNYIGENFKSSQLSLNSISDEFKLNNTYISNMFKKEYGINILEYIHTKRITFAKGLLEDSELTISEISEKVGYYSYRTFSSIFKQIERMTPSEFRKKKYNFKLNVKMNINEANINKYNCVNK